VRQADDVVSNDVQEGQRSPGTKFRPDIEGLRAVAVLAVVLFHAEVPGIGGGFVGVDVFFVISGFLITGLLWRDVGTRGTVRLRDFYGARARRLLPAAAAVGIATMIASSLLLPPLQVPTVLRDGIASALYVSNLSSIAQNVDYFADLSTPSPFLHYWSLGVEEQFYLVWPALILATAWLIRRVRRRTRTQATNSQRPYLMVLAVIVVVSFALSLFLTYLVPAAAFFSLPTRAWQLGLGGLVALTAGRWSRLAPRTAAITGWTGLALIVLSCTWLSATTPYPGTAALLPTLGAVLVIGAGCATPTHGCGGVLAVPPMQAIGRISYSWYLWHWPVLIFAPALVGHSLELVARVTAALLSALLAWLTLRYLENPLRFATKIRNSSWRSLALGGAATAVAVCAGVALLKVVPIPIGHGAPATPVTITAAPTAADSGLAAYDNAVRQTFAEVQSAVAASANLKAVPSNLTPPLTDAPVDPEAMLFNGCLRSDKEAGQPECAFGDSASKTTLALVGDSHAAMWNPAFLHIATQRHWRLEIMAKMGCPLLDVPMANHLGRLVERFRHCEKWRGEIVARLQAERPTLIVVSVSRVYGSSGSWQLGFSPYDPAWLDSLTRLVQQLRKTGAQVLVLGPVPSPQSAVPICLSGHLDDASACSPSRSTAVNQTGIAAEFAATQAGGGHYADLTNLFCTAERCPVIVGNALVYVDSNHLTPEYARALAPAMGTLADRALAQG